MCNYVSHNVSFLLLFLFLFPLSFFSLFFYFLICNFDFGCKDNTFIIDKRKILAIS
ncbi:Uncharacterised protein [Segatella copri]|nr:Uncharacterised protein [Segatella copri]